MGMNDREAGNLPLEALRLHLVTDSATGRSG
jgi:hypothetical protein